MSSIAESQTAESGTVKVNWVNVVGITFYHLIAALAFLPYFFNWTSVFVAALGTLVFGMIGINVFYHRYLTHKGFRCRKWAEYVMAVLAVCCFQDTPARWVAVHRRHHEHADDEWDPHTPLRNFLWAHVGWILVNSPDLSRYEIFSRYAKDILRDPFYRALEKQHNYLGIIYAQWVIYFGVGAAAQLMAGGTAAQALQFGASLLFWGVFVRTVFNWHCTWSVNSVTHIWGYRNYETDENSRNNFLVGLLANGEGWHNNHHADPRSARHGHRWWELDITYLAIRLLKIFGVIWQISEPRHLTIGSTIKTRVTVAPEPILPKGP